MFEDEKTLGLILDTMTEGIQGNTVDVLALLSLLEDKGLITREEFNVYRKKEETKMEEMVEKALKNAVESAKSEFEKKHGSILGNVTDDDSSFLNGLFGKGGNA